jgi:hypothetical protein
MVVRLFSIAMGVSSKTHLPTNHGSPLSVDSRPENEKTPLSNCFWWVWSKITIRISKLPTRNTNIKLL